jgi:uncharacterized membrane protein
MPYFSFIHPGALWLLLILVPLWALALLTPRRLSPLRFWASLGLRSTLIVLLVLAIAGTQFVSGVDQLTTVFLIDSSDSVSPSMRSRAEAFVQDALEEMPEGDQAAVIIFGENALVERAPTSSRTLGRITSAPVAVRTNIEEAIQLGLALFPADSEKRLVLLSDGGQNTGQAQEAAQLAVTRGVPIETVSLAGPGTGDEALVADLQAPETVREGQDVELIASVESTVAQAATLRVFADQEVVVDRTVQLEAGSNQFRVTVPAEGQGFRRYRAQIEPQQDARVQNNESAVLVQVQGPPRVLLVASDASDAENLRAALQAANVTAEISAPAQVPTDLTSLTAYDAVVLVNVAARDLPVQSVAALPVYVRELGRGLVMIGGDESYGVGGYGDTPIEEALPVYMDVRDREERPDLALVFVIDKSGSMDACHCSGPNRQNIQTSPNGEPKIDIAKEAVIQAAGLLSERDTLGIVAFDTTARWVLPAVQGASTADVSGAISPVRPRGNTNVRSGLLAAEDVLNNTDAQIKHVILLTDGWGEGGSNVDLAERMRDSGITLSVVAAGTGSATFLDTLAQAGGGRYYASDTMTDVPEIFLQETIMAAGNFIVERPFLPVVTADSPILGGVSSAGLPPLYGFNGSTLKDTARNVLVTDDDSPLLAQWQYGLGRSIAWTSDTRGQWARDWVQWQQFPQFAAQMVGWVLPTSDVQSIATEIELTGGQATVVATLEDINDATGEDLELTARLVPSSNHDLTDDDETALEQDITLEQVAPGEYRAVLESPPPGSYLVQIQGQHNGRAVAQQTSGLVVPYSAEYRQDQEDPELLASLRNLTGGSELAAPAAAFDHTIANVVRAQEIAMPLLLLVLVLLPLDIALRRLLFQQRDVQQAQAWLGGRLRLAARGSAGDAASPTGGSTLERLSQAKRRAVSSGQKASQTSSQNQQQSEAGQHSPPVPPRSTPDTPAPPAAAPASPPPASDEDQDPLERLRAAKARARRRVRGED